MSLVPNRAIEGAAGNQGYNIQRSLRFRSSASAYLSRTPASSGNQKTFTFSFWLKRGLLGNINYTFYSATTGTEDKFYFSNDNLVWINNSANDYYLNTTQVFRDPSAWYHIVYAFDTTQATAANRVKLYVNGVQVTAFQSASYPPQDYTFSRFNTAGVSNAIGRDNNNSQYFDGYLADVNFIDGQALTPSSFGETDSTTGAWIPKRYGGSYGTNGFYLNFSDNTSATTLAYDKSGNGNNWTANNISTTAGATYDSMTDVPTLTSTTAANYATMNPIAAYSDSGGAFPYTIRSANLNVYSGGSTGSWGHTFSTIGASSGKWYFECLVSNITSSLHVGISQLFVSGYFQNQATSRNINLINGNSNSGAYNLSAFSANDVLNVAFDVDAGKVWFGKNGTWGNSGDPATATNPCFTDLTVGATYFAGIDISYTGEVAYNFGQRPFSYTPPTGFKALNTFNLPDPTIKKPNQYMDVGLYTGTGSASALAVSGPPNPDLVWIKGRSVAYSHSLLDNQRTTGTPFSRRLYSNLTSAEYDYGSSLLTPTTTGFNLTTSDGDHNTSGATYVGWQWKESATAGFDIVTYSGSGSTQNIAHNLGVAPAFIIVKGRNVGSTNWFMYHQSLGATKYIDFSTGGAGNDSTAWNNTAPTSSVFTVGSSYYTNYSGTNYVAYVWAEIPGFSKFGSYTGNYNNDGPFIYTGFKPKWVMVKNIATGATSWFLEDSVRDPYNYAYHELCPSNANAERTTDDIWFDFLSNGFKPRNQSWGHNYNDYIYMAFAENPFKYSNAR